MELKKGQEFKNFKALCVYMRWIDKDKVLSTGSKRKLEKDLSQICCWQKSNGSNIIIIKDVYEKKKKRTDGRSSNNKYVNLIEKILICKLEPNDTKIFLSNSKIANMIGIYNSKIHDAIKDRSIFAQKYEVDLYVLTIFLNQVRCEVSKIITRAMSSMMRNEILKGEKGTVLITNEIEEKVLHRMAIDEEILYIKQIEKKVLNKLGCKNKGIASFKNVYKIFYNDVMCRLHNKFEYIEAYYEGYYINDIDNSIINEVTEEIINDAKAILNNIIVERIIKIGQDIHKKAIKEEYSNVGFGEPALINGKSNDTFISEWKKIISIFWE